MTADPTTAILCGPLLRPRAATSPPSSSASTGVSCRDLPFTFPPQRGPSVQYHLASHPRLRLLLTAFSGSSAPLPVFPRCLNCTCWSVPATPAPHSLLLPRASPGCAVPSPLPQPPSWSTELAVSISHQSK